MRVHRLGNFELNPDLLVLTYSGEHLGLGPKVVETLLALIEHAGEITSKDALLARVWPSGFVAESNLAQNIYVLRKAFKQRGYPQIIETVPGYGYRLTAQFEDVVMKVQTERPRRYSAVRAIFAAFALAAAALVAFVALSQPYARPAVSPSRAERFYQIGGYYWNMRS